MNAKITSITLTDLRITPKTLWRHVIVATSDGLTGMGEYSFDDALPGVPDRAARLLRPLIGQPGDPGTISGLCPSSFEAAAILSAAEQALTDIAAARQGVPVWRWLAPEQQPDPVSLYANINRRTVDRSPGGFAASARDAMSQGFTALKLAPFDGVTPQTCDSPAGRRAIDQGLDRIRAVAAEAEAEADAGAAGQAQVMVDCHWRFTPATATTVLEALAEIGVTWYECPLPETPQTIADIVALRHHANARDMRLTGLEMATCWDEVRPFAGAGAYDVIMPDVKYAGGFSGLMDIAARAGNLGAAVSIHNPSGPMSHMASVHCAAALSNGQRLEMQFDESPLFGQIAGAGVRARGGTAPLPRQPGLGAALDPDRLAGLVEAQRKIT